MPNQPTAADLDAVATDAAARLATTTAITPSAAVLPLTPEEIDNAVARVDFLQQVAKAADKQLDDEKAKLIFLVEQFGHQPKDAGQSKRLTGHHHEATITWSTSYTVIETIVEELRAYLSKQGLSAIMSRFFVPVTKHKLVDGARDVLRTLTLSNRHREKIASLVGLAIDVKTSAPALKIKTIQPEKPARTKKAKAA